jgi:F0F1-type ATP synthase membrane subunit b/b'
MKNIKFQIAIAIVCVVLGLMVSIQVRTVKQGVGPVSEYRARELASQLKKVKDENSKLLNAKKEYEAKIKEFEDTASQGSASAKKLKQELVYGK